MEIKSLGDALKKTVQDTASNIKEATKDVKMPEIKASDLKNIKMPNIKMPEIKIPDQIKNLGKSNHEEQPSEEVNGYNGISVERAIKIIYCLMAVDGKIEKEEEDRFLQIGESFMDGFSDAKDDLIEDCQKRIDVESGVKGRYEAIEQIVEEYLTRSTQRDVFMNPRLFVWDLLTIAYSDSDYDENEKKLIDFIVNTIEMENVVFLEMQSSMLTVIDIDNEINWIKTTNRPYLKIEAVINELESRKNTILESIMELIIM